MAAYLSINAEGCENQILAVCGRTKWMILEHFVLMYHFPSTSRCRNCDFSQQSQYVKADYSYKWRNATERITSNKLMASNWAAFAKSLISVNIAIDAEAATRFANCCEGINERSGRSLRYLTLAGKRFAFLVFLAIPFRTIDISIRARHYRILSAMKMLYLGCRFCIIKFFYFI